MRSCGRDGHSDRHRGHLSLRRRAAAHRPCTAILKDAPIVVLDEATAFADPENEVLIQKAFAALTKGRTVIMIAHRLSTVIGADRIIVLDKGRIAGQGTHGSLWRGRSVRPDVGGL